MGVKLISNRGNVIITSKEKAKELIESGKAKKFTLWESAMRQAPENAMRPKVEPKKNIYPKATGGGWYILSNKKKIQGKEKAIEAEKNLKNER